MDKKIDLPKKDQMTHKLFELFRHQRRLPPHKNNYHNIQLAEVAVPLNTHKTQT
jgi:hypothetical protein